MKTNDYGLNDLRSSVAQAKLSVAAVSDWSIGMHIHHCCLVMIEICHALMASTPPPPRGRWSLRTSLMFLSGRIARGRGRSPEAALPRQGVTTEELMSLIDQSQGIMADVSELEHDKWFRHFAFGVLNTDKAFRFIGIHNRHHLRIIADIARPDGRKSW